MAQFEDSLKAALYRITCPDGAALGNYHLGLLPDEAAATIAQHVATCPHCTHEIAQLEAFLGETAVSLQPATSQRIKVWIAQRLPTGGPAGTALGTPAFALRGGDTGPLMYQAGDAQLSLEVQDDPEHPGRKSILGLVLGIETTNVEAKLLRGDVVETAVSLNPGGNFTVTNLAPGSYQLLVSGPDFEIQVSDLTIA
ncbi:MAG: hypothetical protein R3D55_25180 [Chloroflexota bacterium]